MISDRHIRSVRAACMLFVACGATGCGTWGSGFFGLEFWRQDCSEYQQVKNNIKADIAVFNDMHAKAEITESELIRIDQDAANYSSRMKDLCGFVISRKMTINEYLTEIDKAHERYLSARRLVFAAQAKTRQLTNGEK